MSHPFPKSQKTHCTIWFSLLSFCLHNIMILPWNEHISWHAQSILTNWNWKLMLTELPFIRLYICPFSPSIAIWLEMISDCASPPTLTPKIHQIHAICRIVYISAICAGVPIYLSSKVDGKKDWSVLNRTLATTSLPAHMHCKKHIGCS